MGNEGCSKRTQIMVHISVASRARSLVRVP